MAATGEHEDLPQLGDELRQIRNEPVHAAEGDDEVPVTGDVAVDIAVPTGVYHAAEEATTPWHQSDSIKIGNGRVAAWHVP
ncbi:MAG TPA: hypothetical protein VGT40_07760 [Methylomirabilota bacterium]|nr:hypothetical protein [Methylomirabilota bacterium]